MKRSYISILLFAFVLSVNAVQAQDVHFSQFYNTPILYNPGLTGIFTEDYKVGALYRSQWSSIAIPFETGLIDLETKVRVNAANDFISFGLLGYSDHAGAIDFKTVGVYPAINYNKSLDDKFGSYLSLGITAGYIQRSIDISKMTFDNQYQNGGYSAGYATGESQIPNSHLQTWDLGGGITFSSSFDEDNKINYYIGAAAYHLTKMNTTFYVSDADANTAIKLTGSAGLDYELDDAYSLRAFVNFVEQNPYQELIGGGLIRWGTRDQYNRQNFALNVGAMYRLGDAVIPTIKVEYKNYSIAMSYDVNISSLKTATNMQGGFEISLFAAGMFSKSFDDKHLCPRF